MADFLLQSWNTAGRARLNVSEIEPGHLHIPEVRCEERRDTVSSLRLDAVCATGFRMARGKAAALIESGRVQLNWRECTKPDRQVSAGDTVSARGFGKFELTEIGGLTKKGRIPAESRDVRPDRNRYAFLKTFQRMARNTDWQSRQGHALGTLPGMSRWPLSCAFGKSFSNFVRSCSKYSNCSGVSVSAGCPSGSSPPS